MRQYVAESTRLPSLPRWLPIVAVAGLGMCLLSDYFVFRFQLALALLCSPFVFAVRQPGRFSNRYLVPTLLFLALYNLVTMKLMLFLGMGCLLLYIIESTFGKTGLLPFIFLVCISPALHYAVNVFTFDLRIQLSETAAHLLSTFGFRVNCEGNYFTMPDGSSFNVDKACLGLNMFSTGLAFCTLIIALKEREQGKNLAPAWLLLLYGGVCALLVLSNLLRIILIVMFRAMPGTIAHEITGLIALVLYTCVPAFFITRYIVTAKGKSVDQADVHRPAGPYRLNYLFLSLAFLISFYSVSKREAEENKDPLLNELSLNGYQKSTGSNGVAEFRKKDVLVYVKPAVRAFESDHPPAICWRASGFDVEKVEQARLGNQDVFCATLQKDKLVQYTCWWYDNGVSKTISQAGWRLSGGEAFRLVNVTSHDKETMKKTALELLNRNLFAPAP